MIKQVVCAFSWLTVLGTVFCASLVQADCVCPHYPQGQQGGSTLYYATVHDDNCNYLYATGYASSSSLSNKNCVGTCATSPCFPLGAGSQDPLWFTPALWTYDKVDTPAEFMQYLDHINNGIHLPTYDHSTFELVGTVELSRNAGVPTFYAVVYKVSASGANVFYMGVEISNSDGNPLKNRPYFNAVQTYANQHGTLEHHPVPGMLTVDLGNFRYAAVHLNKATNSGATFAACNPPVHTPLPHPPHARAAATSNSFVLSHVMPLTTTQAGPSGQICNGMKSVCYCIPRRARSRRCR
jgi:hypothetical protein